MGKFIELLCFSNRSTGSPEVYLFEVVNAQVTI